MNNNSKTMPCAPSESEETSFELSDSELDEVHGGIVIGSRPKLDATVLSRRPALVVRTHGAAE